MDSARQDHSNGVDARVSTLPVTPEPLRVEYFGGWAWSGSFNTTGVELALARSRK